MVRLLFAWPLWLLGMAAFSSCLAFGVAGPGYGALFPWRDDGEPTFRATLEPGQQAVLGNMSVVNGSRAPTGSVGSLRAVRMTVSVQGDTLTIQIPRGMSISVASRRGSFGSCENVRDRSHVARCRGVEAGAEIEVVALVTVIVTPTPLPPR